ncbi:MAG: trehalase family glycosidase [bacterium]
MSRNYKKNILNKHKFNIINHHFEFNELQPDITHYEDYKTALFAVNKVLDIKVPAKRLDKYILYKFAMECSVALSNPLINLVINSEKSFLNLRKIQDNKTYADAILKKEKKCDLNRVNNFKILYKKFKNEQTEETFREVESLIEEYFTFPEEDKSEIFDFNINLSSIDFSYYNKDYQRTAEYIHNTWKKLAKQTAKTSYSSLIPLPKPFIVPGGRFREIYYWDSFYTIIGLLISKLDYMAKNMVDNFLYLVEYLGFIPNSNRVYHLSRSQPPYLAEMIETIRPKCSKKWLKRAFNLAKKEYFYYWMNPQTNYLEGYGLNRYFDPVNQARPESYGSDNVNSFIGYDYYSHERSECESGWDFTRRFHDRAHDFIPVDLNCLLYRYEKLFEKWSLLFGNFDEAKYWKNKAIQRKSNINKYLWNESEGLYFDYDLIKQKHSDFKSSAGFMPLKMKVAGKLQAEKVRKNIVEKFETDNGVVSSYGIYEQSSYCKEPSEYQWDSPNGWAPIQFITVYGLLNYGYEEDAKRIAKKWLDFNTRIFLTTGSMFEKYNVIQGSAKAETSYPQQTGFGWTNGVYLDFLSNFIDKADK